MKGTYVHNELEQLLDVIKDAVTGGFKINVKKSKSTWIVEIKE